MARPYHPTHRIADYISESVVDARAYAFRIATFPASRFVEPATVERRALVPAPRPPVLCKPWGDFIAAGVMCAVLLASVCWLVPFLIAP